MGILGNLFKNSTVQTKQEKVSQINRKYNELIRKELEDLLERTKIFSEEIYLGNGVSERLATIALLKDCADIKAQSLGAEFELDIDLAEKFSRIVSIRYEFEKNQIGFKRLLEEQDELKARCKKILAVYDFQLSYISFKDGTNGGHNGYRNVVLMLENDWAEYTIRLHGKLLYVMPYLCVHDLILILVELLTKVNIFDDKSRNSLVSSYLKNEGVAIIFDDSGDICNNQSCVIAYKYFKFQVRFERKILNKSHSMDKLLVSETSAEYNSKTTEEIRLVDCDNMDGHEFEHYCAQLLRRNGYKNVSVTQGSGDQGIDVIAFRDGVKYGIQCKCYSADIGNKAVQEVFAGKTFYQCHVGIVLTNRYFTKSAIELARVNGVILWDRDKLIELIDNANRE